MFSFFFFFFLRSQFVIGFVDNGWAVTRPGPGPCTHDPCFFFFIFLQNLKICEGYFTASFITDAMFPANFSVESVERQTILKLSEEDHVDVDVSGELNFQTML